MKARSKAMKIIDVSQIIHTDMQVYPGDPHFHSHPVSSFRQGNVCEVSEITIGTHCGTHVDAPSHMIPFGAPLQSLPLDCFIGPCRVITLHASIISEKALLDLDIKEGERILFRTDPDGRHMKSQRINPAVLSMRAAQYLISRGVKLVGIDSPSVENMEVSDGELHRKLLKAGIAILEGLDLCKAEKDAYFLSALPLRLDGENGSPCRAVLVEFE